MPYARKRRTANRPKPRFRARGGMRKRPLRTNKSLTKTIRRVINRQAETKSVQTSVSKFPMCLQQSGSVIGGNVFIMTPSQATYGYNISRGTSNNNMIGNKIRITSLIQDIVIVPLPYDGTTNTQVRPSIVRLYYFKSKRNPAEDPNIAAYANSSTTATADFFDLSSGDYGFIGGLFDMTRKIAPENYTYLTHRTYKVGNATPALTAGTTTAHALTNNDYKMSVISRVNLTRYVNKTPWTKDDAGNWTKPWIICLIQVVSGNGDIYTTSQLPVNVQFNVSCKFKDE